MRHRPTRMDFNFQVSPLAKRVLIALVSMYVAQLLAMQWLGLPLMELGAWWPFASGGFHIWQPLTAPFLQGPDPFGALLGWVMVFFFFSPAEQTVGRNGLLQAAGAAYAATLVLGFLGLWSGAVSVAGIPYFGLEPFLTMLVVLFGLTRPNAQILLFFVLPIRASWVAWGSGLLALLYFLFSRDLDSLSVLTGWIGGYLWLQARAKGGVKQALQSLKPKPDPRSKHAETQERLRKFTVYEGGGDGKPSNGAGRPGWAQGDDDDPIVH